MNFFKKRKKYIFLTKNWGKKFEKKGLKMKKRQ